MPVAHIPSRYWDNVTTERRPDRVVPPRSGEYSEKVRVIPAMGLRVLES